MHPYPVGFRRQVRAVGQANAHGNTGLRVGLQHARIGVFQFGPVLWMYQAQSLGIRENLDAHIEECPQ